MLLYVEEMQSQQRAENGISEKIIGYVGYEWEPEADEIDMTLIGEFGPAYTTSVKDLPRDLQDVLAAENHRLKTGEVLTVDAYKRTYGEGVS